MDILAQQHVAYEILDNLSSKDIDHYCWIFKYLRPYCQSDAYWQHRITHEFGIPSEPTDTQKIYDWLIFALPRAKDFLRRSPTGEFLRKTSPTGRFMRFLPLFVRRLIDEEHVIEENVIDTALFGAVYESFYISGILNRPDLITQLIRKFGPDGINKALLGAAESGYLDLLKWIIDLGADDFGNALQAAARKGHIDVVNELLNRGLTSGLLLAPEIRRALNTAAEHGHMPIVTALIGQVPNPISALKYAAKGGRLGVIDELNQRGITDPDVVLIGAAEGGHLDLVNKAIGNGATNVNRALLGAIDGGHLNIVRELIRYEGVDLIEALRLAIWSNRLNVIDELIKREGVDLNNALFHAINQPQSRRNDKIILRIINQMLINRTEVPVHDLNYYLTKTIKLKLREPTIGLIRLGGDAASASDLADYVGQRALAREIRDLFGLGG